MEEDTQSSCSCNESFFLLLHHNAVYNLLDLGAALMVIIERKRRKRRRREEGKGEKEELEKKGRGDERNADSSEDWTGHGVRCVDGSMDFFYAESVMEEEEGI